jgi:hypothetical protein
MSIANKNEYLFQNSINFHEPPNWQNRDISILWEEYKKYAVNIKSGKLVKAKRKRLYVDYDLPTKDQYSNFILGLITAP